MDGWGVAATLFAAGAFALGLFDLWRRWQTRPFWSWAPSKETLKSNDRRHRVDLQLMADVPAHHVAVDGVGLTLWQGHTDDDHHRAHWPHLGTVAPSDPPLRLYVEEEEGHDQPHLVATWSVPPMRAERSMEQRIPVWAGAPLGPPPYELRSPKPWEKAWWRRRWQAIRDRLTRRGGDAPGR